MDEYTNQLTGYFLLTVIGALFIVLEAIAIELRLPIYWIVFLGIILSASEGYLILIIKHFFKVPIVPNVVHMTTDEGRLYKNVYAANTGPKASLNETNDDISKAPEVPK